MRSSILRYRRWQDRQATLLGKMLLWRALLQEDRQTGQEKFRSLQATRYGKPFIPGGPEFNISHSGEMVVLAVSRNGVVGIDIERIRTINLQDFFQHVPELLGCKNSNASEALPLFFELWTQKEALLKAAGTGLLASPDPIKIQEGQAQYAGSKWYIQRIPVREEYLAHIATDRPPPKNIAIEQVDFSTFDSAETLQFFLRG